MQFALSLAVPVGTWVVWTVWSLLNNYRIAKRTNLPIIISPVSSLNPLWIVTYKLFPPTISVLNALPVGRWPRCMYMGWQFDDKCKLHEELGPAFVLCTPSLNEVILADPDAAHHVLHRRKDFIKPAIMYDGLNVFGKNLDSVEGETWQRHRKITAPNFNEKVSSAVWEESRRQAKQMLQEWMQVSNRGGTKDTVDDTAALALNVLTSAGFGIQYDFSASKTQINPPHEMSYRDALHLILRNFTVLVILPINLLKLSFLPRKLQDVGKACEEFKLYMKETVEKEKNAISDVGGKAGAGEGKNLLGALVRASHAEEKGLTDEELYGNIFIYNMAGHETTANTLATSIMYLAAMPKWQDWIHEDVSNFNDSNNGEWSYEIAYARLNRCKAVMLETLRLHGSVVFLPKAATATQQFRIGGRECMIPEHSFVIVNSQAIHCNINIWGKDALEWRPSRWIQPTEHGKSQKEELIEPRPGTFVAWADGPRICPGKKFSQVEFVGVLSTLFLKHRVSPETQNKESRASVQTRLERMIDDSAITAITLQMKRPRDVPLVWTAR